MRLKDRTAAICFSLSAAEISADPFVQEGTSIYCWGADQSQPDAVQERQRQRGREEETGGEDGLMWRTEERRGEDG